MSAAVFEITSPGFGATMQDRGRIGWRRWGVPPGGAMDDHAAAWANRLLDNPADAPVLELLWQSAELAVRRGAWIAITGAQAAASHPMWRALRVESGETLRFGQHGGGVWTYLAVEGGFDAPRHLGSASVYARGGLGRRLERGDVLRRDPGHDFQLPEHVAGRVTPWTEQRDYGHPPVLRVWPGPQWDFFSDAEQQKFFTQSWTVSSQSDRVGYRLTGEALPSRREQIISEPVRVGTIQIPESGQPIVTMRDGPTVGGYLKLGLVDPWDLSWLAQSCPGQAVRFRLAP